MKRMLAVGLGILLGCAPGHAQKEPCATPGENSAFLGIQTIRLWPGEAPQAKGTGCEDTPTLTIFAPQSGHENGSAVVILPGGAYQHLAGNLEGRQVADWFTARGFRAFILSYRLSSNGYLLPVPLLDARRAVQTVRGRAGDYHINPDRIVMIGFSAGDTWRRWRQRSLWTETRMRPILLSGHRAGRTSWCLAIRGLEQSPAIRRT